MINLIDIKNSHQLFDNHYQLVEKIGGGGFSEVWLAHDTVAGIDVALKIYTPNGELDEEGKQDFKREFARLCDINHSNIIHAIGFGIHADELPYLAMSVCRNGSAKKLIGKIDEEELWNFIEQVAAGLQYLHKRGIIHQDMKPDNVLINSDGQYLIIDFGISTKTRNTLRKSTTGSVGGGTPWYMSVESFGNESPSVYARDIWAFGASLYEMMTGDVPFDQFGGVTQKARDGKVPAIQQPFSDELKQLVYDCLALNAWDRPDADQIMQRVANHKAGIGLKRQFPPRTVAYMTVFVIATVAVCCLWAWLYTTPNTNGGQTASTTSRNDSILIVKIKEATAIVNEEKAKNKVSSINEEKLCSAARIYQEAIKMEVSDSVKDLGMRMWDESQQVIDFTYKYLYISGARYSLADAPTPAKEFGQRSKTLKEYASATAIEDAESEVRSLRLSKSTKSYDTELVTPSNTTISAEESFEAQTITNIKEQ